MDQDPHDLQRFVRAQASTYETALGELRAGRKRTHWIWFVFPQMRGLGLSPMSQAYGIASLDEARAYLAHPVLGPRLEACTRAVLAAEGATLHAIFGTPDDMKFRSSMTLFAEAAASDAATAARETDKGLYREALERFCAGQGDPRTLDLLRT